MQAAPAPAPTTVDNDDKPRLIHRSHRCNQQPGTHTRCGLLTASAPIPPQRARKHIPCAVCDDLMNTPCDRCEPTDE